ncbi:hypothetical protein Q4566_00210 [Tamlana sp. 2_MG-2023]|uniref:hypothetical protein n=1 Tax=unclassified Tamlana TaxID=2614803 RepID=UPI0026E43966|nr:MULTISPECIES: hypothetical protein [unclassified Tamlana]MDO6758604.1 hypothetical protein [Tamlana sp. 2_MG-2023]MDO6789303.1 hypothetical protein [Tamlana sp. 1_MG-2023]
MKYLLILTLLLITQSVDLEVIRSDYKYAAQDSSKIEALYQDLESVTKTDRAELVAYKGAAVALMAKEANSIKGKKDGFLEGTGLVEYAVERESNNIEVRFVRLSIQQNIPKFLRYYSDIENDKAFILDNYSSINSASLKSHIADYISHSKDFTEEEKARVAGF